MINVNIFYSLGRLSRNKLKKKLFFYYCRNLLFSYIDFFLVIFYDKYIEYILRFYILYV